MKQLTLLILIFILSACTDLQEVKKDTKKYHSKGFVEIRENEQYLTISTEDTNKPVLLYLHGGPGGALTPMTSLYFKELEKDYIVVLWDQRGAGKSFKGFITSKYQTIDSFVEDTKEVTNYLKEKFNKEKVFLVGNSWGSLLGMETIKKYPEMYYAYVGTGQLIDTNESLKMGYDLILKKTLETQNIELEKILKKINKNKLTLSNNIKNLSTRKYLAILNSEEKIQETEYKKNRLLEKGMKLVPVKQGLAYSNFLINYEEYFVYKKLRKEIISVDLRKKIFKVNIPIYFAQGKNDLITPYSLLEEYYKILESPKKELICFENSGHGPEYQESEKFTELMRRVQKETLNQ